MLFITFVDLRNPTYVPDWTPFATPKCLNNDGFLGINWGPHVAYSTKKRKAHLPIHIQGWPVGKHLLLLLAALAVFLGFP